MFPSCSGIDLTRLDDVLLSEGSYTYDENPNLGQSHEHHSSFAHFPMLLLDQDDEVLVNPLFSQQQHPSPPRNSSLAGTEGSVVVTKAASNVMANEEVPRNRRTKKLASLKRSGKEDQHTKIYTAQGPRDRRMRLSLPVARRFFDLHDMLGFDKASKTIEWLFTKSRKAIRDLTKNIQEAKLQSTNGQKNTSAASENAESDTKGRENFNRDLRSQAIVESSHMTNPREKKESKLHKAQRNRVSKESREKARERARKRTREKMKSRVRVLEDPKLCSDKNPRKLEQRIGGNLDIHSYLAAVTKEKESQPDIQLIDSETRMDSMNISENYLGFASAPTFSSYSQRVPTSNETNSTGTLVGSPGDWENNWLAITGNVLAKNLTPFHNAQRMTNMVMRITSNAQNSHLSPIFVTNSAAQRQNSKSTSMDTLSINSQNPISLAPEGQNISLVQHLF